MQANITSQRIQLPIGGGPAVMAIVVFLCAVFCFAATVVLGGIDRFTPPSDKEFAMQHTIALPGNTHLPKGLLNNTSGLFITGDPGSGKSVLAREIVRWSAQQDDVTLILLDPDNDLWEDCQRDLSDMPARVRSNSRSFFPADTMLPIGPINPLAVDRLLCRNNTEYEARVECRVMHASHLQLSAVNQDNLDGAPRLFKWISTINRSLAKLGMTIPDGEAFFDVGSDLYGLLTAAVPDSIAQLEFARLACLKIGQQEEQLESVKNRYTALLGSPIMRAHLGCVDDTLPLRRLIQQNANLYFNLSQGQETLSVEAQNLLANMILSEVFHILFTTPRSERTMVVIVCDELPVFRSSAPMISRFLRRARKLGGRFIGLAQGTQVFPEGTADRLLHAMTSCCNGVFMRHTDPVDADYFGKVISYPRRQADRVKFEHEELRQVHARNAIFTLVNRSITKAYSDTVGEAGAAGRSGGLNEQHTATVGDSEQATHTESQEQSTAAGSSETEGQRSSQGSGERFGDVGQLYGQARHEVTGKDQSKTASETHTVGEGSSDALSAGRNRSASRALARNSAWSQEGSWNRSRNRSGSWAITFNQQIVPVYVWKKFIRLELMSFDEQDQEDASAITRLMTGEGFFYAAGEPIVRAYISPADDYLLRTPESAAHLLTDMYTNMLVAPFYRLADDILRQREDVRRLFSAKLQKYTKKKTRQLPPPDMALMEQAFLPDDCQLDF